MNKNNLTKEVAVSEKLTLSTAVKAVDSILSIIAEKITNGENIQLRGFGAFVVVNKPQRVIKDIKTGKLITIPARKSVRFKPSKDIVTKLNR